MVKMHPQMGRMKIQALVQYIVINLDDDLNMTVFYQMWAQLLVQY